MKLINFIRHPKKSTQNPKLEWKDNKGDAICRAGPKVIWQLESLPDSSNQEISAIGSPISGALTFKDVGYVVSSWIRNPRPGGLVV
jgi:hypothetical protein